MPRWLPPALHRSLLRLAHRLRHRWRNLARIPLAGVSIVAHDAAGRVLLVRHSYGPPVWALPGGGLKRGEAPEAAALREMREELGCGLVQIERFAMLEETISGAPHTAHLFAARIDGTLRPDRREVIEARFFPRDALPENTGNLTRRRLEALSHR